MPRRPVVQGALDGTRAPCLSDEHYLLSYTPRPASAFLTSTPRVPRKHVVVQILTPYRKRENCRLQLSLTILRWFLWLPRRFEPRGWGWGSVPSSGTFHCFAWLVSRSVLNRADCSPGCLLCVAEGSLGSRHHMVLASSGQAN